ncbi:MAG TPA: hypothetical protein VFN23_04370, partial [Ktedonobacteraceae bacterium]|nr:hypothetical protein [Ktedonobacteraceae bacterium]
GREEYLRCLYGEFASRNISRWAFRISGNDASWELMSMALMAISFQPDLIGVMSQFSQFEATLKKHIAIATEKSAGRLGDQMIEHMTFVNPTGQLADSIEVQMQSEYLAWVGSPLPYSWRRDRGFSGMTDSLGRFYPHDPGVLYAEYALESEAMLQDIASNYVEAIFAAWQECIGNLPGGTAAFVSAA